ncbi:MAG: prolyl oligopeptidase family serine peptidase [Longimicrobiales bacterium]|nr:prolyl oligopeptidase family serine peptidase [Longimicrobiales bacterium]
MSGHIRSPAPVHSRPDASALGFLLVCAVCGLLVLLPAPGRAQAGESLPLTWENIFTESTGARDASLSPDGRVVAVAASTPQGSGIFLVPVAGGDPVRLIAGGSSPVWMPHGGALLVSARGDLWIVPVEDGLQALAEGPAAGRGPLRDPGSPPGDPVVDLDAPSPGVLRLTHDDDGERAARPSPDGRTVAFYSGRGGAQDIWLVDADGSGTPRRLTRESMAPDDLRFAPGWSPDGSRIAYFSNKADYWEDDIWVVDVASRVERRISRGLMASSTPVWSPDGTRIALLGTAKDEYWYEDLAYLYVLDPEAGTERRVEMQVHATDWLHNLGVFWSADGSELFFPFLQRGRMELWRVPAQGGVATRMTNMGGHFRSYDTNPVASGFVFVRSTPTRGTDVDYYDVRGGPARQLTDFGTEWQGLVEPEEISYRSWDGLYIQAFLYRPPGFDPSRTYPALVQVHGGGTNSYLHALNTTEQYLAQQGYVVLAVNYRGGSGFGRRFQDLGVQDWANGQARDAAAAATFLRARPWSNGNVGIYGYSYGGITSMAAIARVPDAFDAAVPMAGIYDFADAYDHADRLGKIFIRTGHGGSPEEVPEIYDVSNTLARVENIRTPVLVMHGEEDVRAPFRQYELAVEILQRTGKTYEARSYPGEPHGFRNPMNRIDMYRRLEAWFDRWLRQGR